MNTGEACKELGVSQSTLRRYVETGYIEALTNDINQRLIFSKASVDRLKLIIAGEVKLNTEEKKRVKKCKEALAIKAAKKAAKKKPGRKKASVVVADDDALEDDNSEGEKEDNEQ